MAASKDTIIDFIKDFEKQLAGDFATQWQDNNYFNYCLGMKDTCLEAKSIINNSKDLIIALKELENKRHHLTTIKEKVNRDIYAGAYNMYGYIIKEIQKGVL